MKIVVLLFGPEAAAAGRDRVEIQAGNDASAGCDEIRAALQKACPTLEPMLRSARLAIKGEFAREGQRVAPGDEVAVIGMVSGG